MEHERDIVDELTVLNALDTDTNSEGSFKTTSNTEQGISSNPSEPISSLPSVMRLVDFNLYVNVLGSSAPGIIVAAVEAKPFPVTAIMGGDDLEEAVEKVMQAMLPQVVQQVQFAFNQHPELKKLHAILFVGSWCRVLRYRRRRVPEISDLDDIPAKGYFAFKANSKRRIEKMADKKTREDKFRIIEGDDYNPIFKKVFDAVVRHAAKVSMPEAEVEDEDEEEQEEQEEEQEERDEDEEDEDDEDEDDENEDDNVEDEDDEDDEEDEDEDEDDDDDEDN